MRVKTHKRQRTVKEKDADAVVLKWKDTLFDDLIFDAGQFLHHDVDETRDEARQKADQATDDPATDLQAAETLKTSGEEEQLENRERI